MAHEGKRCPIGIKEVDLINDLIQELRRRVKEPAFRKRLAGLRQQSKRNLAGMEKLVNGLFERYARLLVVRIDLSYRKEVHRENHQVHLAQDIEMALGHRAALINNLRHKPSIFKECLGYIIKLEQGLQGGCHFHTVFFFDGSKVQSDYHRAQMIGNYWVKTITEGKGLFHIGHARAGTRKVMGVGLVDYYDVLARNALTRDALGYFVKDEQLVSVTPPKRVATLTHSKPPKALPKPGPKRRARVQT